MTSHDGLSCETIFLFEDIFSDRFALSLARGLDGFAARAGEEYGWVLRAACGPDDLGGHYPEARLLVARQGYCICRLSRPG